VYLPGVDENPVIPPGRHELGKVMLVQGLESTGDGFSCNKSSNYCILLVGLTNSAACLFLLVTLQAAGSTR
jgi:hypothetical protein